MPKVKIFTAAQNRKRDRIAKGLKKRGCKTSSSYAIATASVKKSRKRRS